MHDPDFISDDDLARAEALLMRRAQRTDAERASELADALRIVAELEAE